MLSTLKDFFKFGIVVFVFISALVGYFVGFEIEESFSFFHLLHFMTGLVLLSAGSLSFNQVQEWKVDSVMPRTSKRPIPSGKISVKLALAISLTSLTAGLTLLYFVNMQTFLLGVLTIVFYNGIYTLYMKRNWAFAAVPGAIPGALPVTLGYSAVNQNIFSSESIYLFMIMFLWQMPHFWTLAIRFGEDYKKGGFPVLPTVLGTKKTKFHIALYTFVYAGLAVASPVFIEARYSYLILVVPFAFKVVWEFFKYNKSQSEKSWLPFFLWTTFSILVFLIAPLADKWLLFVTGDISL